MHQEIVALSATALCASIHRRDVSCQEVLNAYLAQIDAINPRVNALVGLQERGALTALARERDAQLARGESMGVLHGMPQAPKDLLPAAGMRTTRGSPIFARQVSTQDAYVFERMRAAGAVFVGRSNSPEFGLGGHTYNSLYGTTTNAWMAGMSAGGSSGGAAAAASVGKAPSKSPSQPMRTPLKSRPSGA